MAESPPKMSAIEIQQEYYEAVGSVDWELYEKADRKYLLQKVAVALYGPPTKEGNLDSQVDSETDIKGNKSKTHTNSRYRYEKADRKYLLQKVAVALYGPPTKEGNLDSQVDSETDIKDKKKIDFPEEKFKLQGYELRDEEGAMKVFNKICEQAKYSYNNENILIKVLRIVCVVPKKEDSWYKLTPKDYWLDLHNKSGDIVYTWPFHVFCIRQCISMKPGGKACRLYIDHDARVYKDWDAYLTENTLPKSVLVVPKNGQYTGTYDPAADLTGDLSNVMPTVSLSVVPSPALGVGARVLSVTDGLSTVANIGALAGIACALAVPAVAPVALGTAIGVGVVTGAYGIVRASVNLADRGKHEQSIGLKDSEARSYWLNILVSTVGLSSGAAGQVLRWAATSGTNVKIFINAVQVLQFANLTTGALGVANGLGEMIYKFHVYDETPSKLQVFQLTTSILFFGIGAMSNKTAQEIVQDAQAKKINEYRDNLSNNFKKKMFDKMTAETRRLEGTVKGNSDIISGLKKIDNKDEFFGKLAKMNKELNKNKLRISLSSEGNPLINNRHSVGVADLRVLGKSGREQLFQKYGPATVNSKNVPTRLYASNTSANSTGFQEVSSFAIRAEEIIKITNFLMKLSKIDQDFLAQLLSDLSATLHDAFLLICAELLASFIPGEIDFLQNMDQNYKIRIILFVFDYLKSKINVDYSDTNVSFENVMKRYIKDGRIPKETILRLKDKFLNKFRSKAQPDNTRLFDDLYCNNEKFNREFLMLKAGEVLKIGSHEIWIKNHTINKLEEWFKTFTDQIQCDIFLNICFEIISSLSEMEIGELNEINPDDDAIMSVAYFLFFKADITDLLQEDYMVVEILADIVRNLKDELIKWRHTQKLRNRDSCELCQGIRYRD